RSRRDSGLVRGLPGWCADRSDYSRLLLLAAGISRPNRDRAGSIHRQTLSRTLTNLLLCEWPGESDCGRILHRLGGLDVPQSFQTDRGNGPHTCPTPQDKPLEILDICLRDQRQAWTLRSDGIYSQLQPKGNSEGPETIGTQQMLMNLKRTRIG